MSERNGKCAFIPDGYTRDGFIAETDFHPNVQFVYRPTTVTERSVVNGLIRFEHAKGTEAGFAKTENLAAECMASHLVSWDIVDSDGEDVLLSPFNVLYVEPHAFNRMYQIIMGEALSDEMVEQESVKNSIAG